MHRIPSALFALTALLMTGWAGLRPVAGQPVSVLSASLRQDDAIVIVAAAGGELIGPALSGWAVAARGEGMDFADRLRAAGALIVWAGSPLACGQRR